MTRWRRSSPPDPTRGTVALRSGLQVDLRVVPDRSYGAALHYFTGSKAHNIAIRRLGQARGLKINEYGVFRGRKRIAGETEEEVYGSVDLPYIAPELREDHGEIEAAAKGKLPKLIELADLRGDLHTHTALTDGLIRSKPWRKRLVPSATTISPSRIIPVASPSTHGLDEKGLLRRSTPSTGSTRRTPASPSSRGSRSTSSRTASSTFRIARCRVSTW